MTSIIIAIVIVAVLLIFIASSHARITKVTTELDALHDKLGEIERKLPVISKVIDNGMGPKTK